METADLKAQFETLTAAVVATVRKAHQRHFTRDEAAEYLRISARKLDAETTAGNIRRAKLGDGRQGAVVFRRRDLDAYIESRLELDAATAESHCR